MLRLHSVQEGQEWVWEEGHRIREVAREAAAEALGQSVPAREGLARWTEAGAGAASSPRSQAGWVLQRPAHVGVKLSQEEGTSRFLRFSRNVCFPQHL